MAHIDRDKRRQDASARSPQHNSPNAGAPVLAIKYAVTQDNVNSEPWAPDGGDYWAIVGRDHKHSLTVWRHVGLTNEGRLIVGED